MADSSFTYKNSENKSYTYTITSLYEFINEYCVRNNEIADQKVLNRAVLQLKKELQQVIGQIKVLTTQVAPVWSALIEYQPGEIVSYFSNGKATGHTTAEIEDSFYMALPAVNANNEQVKNQGVIPNQNDSLWVKITLDDLYPKLNFSNYVQKNRETTDWSINYPDTNDENPYAAVNLERLNDRIDELTTNLKEFFSSEYISKSNTQNYLEGITSDNKDSLQNRYKPTTINYVENRVKELEKSLDSIDDRLGDYVRVDKSNKLQTTNLGSTENYSFQTPQGGLLPGTAGISNLGSISQKFNYVYANIFQGTATRALYADIAEIIESEKSFEPGTILSMDILTGDLKEYESNDEIFGVVSENPGFILNSEAKGILIAHKGQVKVKVQGKVKKGEIIIAIDNGIGEAVPRLSNAVRHLKIGIALESSDTNDIKLINTMI